MKLKCTTYNGPSKRKKKIAFFENMHRAEEGFNWNEHNKNLCWKKYEDKKQPITELPIEGF